MSESNSTSTPAEDRGWNGHISHDDLLRRLSYNPESGLFTWRECKSKPSMVGEVAGYLRPKDGIVIRINGVRYRAGRLAWFYMTGEWPYEVIDHVDGDPSNNRWSNLRSVDIQTNAQNRRSASASKQDGNPIGAYLHKKSGKYQAGLTATILGKKRSIYLGLYDSPDEAHAVYVEVKRMLHQGSTM